MKAHGWTLLFHSRLLQQWEPLRAAVRRAQLRNPVTFREHASFKLYKALNKMIVDTVPSDPSRFEYRQGNTLGAENKHWRRAKIGRRFRLFFRYDSASRVIVYAWVNDDQTLRSAGSQTDPYAVFAKMLRRGDPPNDWNALLESSRSDWDEGK